MLKKIAWVLSILIVLSGVLAAYAYHEWQTFEQTPLAFPQYPYSISLEKGMSFKQVADQLHQDGVIQHPYYLRLYARYYKLAHRIKAGHYEVKQPLLPEQLLAQLVNGEVVTYNVTLIEGNHFKELLHQLQKHPHLEHQLAGLSTAEIMAKLGKPDLHPEGWFFPSTYQFNKGDSDLDILKRAHAKMEAVLAEEWSGKAGDLPYESAYQALIMASIVEKETGLASERPEIAGVFVRRLKRGMRLQTDPTVIYGMGERYQGNIRKRDLRTDTPYNTYTRDGLPPTPIAMPGQEAIHAALHPKAGKTLYFVAKGDGSGAHYFSKSLAEHNRAVRRYQLSGNK